MADSKTLDILTVGEVLIDLTQTGVDERGVRTLAANPGGPPTWRWPPPASA